MAPNNPNPNRLYTGFISSLKIIQYLGYFTVVGISLMWGIGGFTFHPIIGFIAIVLPSGFGCLSFYVVTQGLIAIVDLLSRIEHNTRPL